jgi:hypothetical protein
MRATHLAVGVVVVSLLAVGATAPAAAQVDGNSGEAICADAPPNGDSLVVVLPDDTYVYANEGVTLLPGTEADIALCSGGDVVTTDGDRWPVSNDIDGVNVTSTDPRSYGITIEDVETRTSPDFESAISVDEISTPDVVVAPGKVTTARVGGSTYRVALDDKQAFTTTNESYVETLSSIRRSAANLNRTANGERRISATSNTTERWVANINQTQAVRDNYTTVQSALFRSARGGSGTAVEALDAYDAYHNNELTQATTDLENANEAIEAQARSTALGVLANFIGVALVGAIVGGVGGRVATNRILSGVEVDRRRSSAVDFSPKHLAGQVGFALLSIVGAVALVVGLGLLAPLVAVVRAVIGV